MEFDGERSNGASMTERPPPVRLWPRFAVFALIIALVVTALGLPLHPSDR